METIGAYLIVLGLVWTVLVGGGGTLLVRNHWGLVAGSPGAVMVFLGAVLSALAQAGK